MATLRIADGLSLPLDFATQTLLVVGKRGSGKSNTCVRLAEQLFKAKVPFVAVDPTDTWWGLKAAKDGKGPGLGVYVFGGRHADLPLEPTAGALVADVVIDHRISAVLSVKHFSGRERGRFVSEFADRLFRRNTEPLHVFLEEAHEVAPQQPFKGEEEMLGRVTRIWKLGRASGLGGSAITQRPASLSKNITTQAEILIVHRMLGPQDVAAVRDWIKYHGESDQVLSQLAEFKTGEAWLWAPDFPEGDPIGLRRVRILERETFNSSATPKAGERQAEPKGLAPVDLDALRSKMAATIERAKAEDPRELRRQIVDLKAELARAKTVAPAPPAEPKTIEVPVFTEAERQDLQDCEARLAELRRTFEDGWHQVHAKLDLLVLRASDRLQVKAPSRFVRPAPVPERRMAQPATSRPATANGHVDLGKGERIILTAVAQYPEGASREQLTILTGYKRSSRDTYLQRLAQRELVAVNARGDLVATDKGMAALGPDFEPLPTGRELQTYWVNRLTGGERAILEALIRAYPRAVDREALSEATEYKRSSRDTYIQRLAARRLVVAIGRGEVRDLVEEVERALASAIGRLVPIGRPAQGARPAPRQAPPLNSRSAAAAS
ncbi:MAG: hypothetical protein ACE147_00520 [Candidatus Methylomirabilales bacterium]